jgi:hypothetical protein
MAPTHYRDGEVASDQNKMALTPSEHETFRVILGSVNFLYMCTRSYIAFAISVISRRSCDEYSPTTVHSNTLYMYSLLNPIHALPSDGRTTWVRRYCNIYKGSHT